MLFRTTDFYILTAQSMFKDLLLKKLKVLFIRLMIPNGAIYFRSKDCHNEVIITSLQGVIKRPLEDNACSSTVY